MPISINYIITDPSFEAEAGTILLFLIGRLGWIPIGFLVLSCELTDDQVPFGTWTREATNWLTFRKGLSNIAKTVIMVPYSIVMFFSLLHMLMYKHNVEVMFVLCELFEYGAHVAFFTCVIVREEQVINVNRPRPNRRLPRFNTQTIIVQQINPDNTIIPLPENDQSIKKVYNSEIAQICTICLDSIIKGTYYYQTKCKHIYHYGCIREWSKQSHDCPICRGKIL